MLVTFCHNGALLPVREVVYIHKQPVIISANVNNEIQLQRPITAAEDVHANHTAH